MHLKLIFGIVVYCTAFNSCVSNRTSYDEIFLPYINMKKPTIFAAELGMKGNVYKGCFSDDYTTFYFFRNHIPDKEIYRIFQSTFQNNKWEDIKEVSFSDQNSDLYPMTSVVERNKLFFISYRKTPSDTSAKPNANFWFVTKINDNWTSPSPFESANLIYNYNSQPCMTKNGNIYFTSDLPDWSKTLTYKMEFKNGIYQNPIPFDFVNKMREEDHNKSFWEICVSPDEKYMIMTISEKGKDAKLHISYFDNENWTYPEYIGNIIKEDMTGNFPYITKDGNFLIFTKAFSAFYILPTASFVLRK